jgi:LuxR family maltose regulon positive regulatory protein
VLRVFRVRAGLSREQLAERANLSAQAISALEQGTRRRPYPQTIAALADALELQPTDRAVLVAAATASGTRTPVRLAPAHGKRVPRERLLERLDAILRCAVTLVAAPAGFGKTSLLVDWEKRARERALVAWLSLDASANDPVRFWRYVLTALNARQPGLGARVLPDVHARALASQVIIDELVRDISRLDLPLVLVLDDYHLIRAEPVHAGVASLIAQRPTQLHLVLASRSNPPLPLARLRANDQLAELREADLRFTADEADHFLRLVMQLDLSSEQVAALHRRTEGWPAALQLAGLYVRAQPRSDAAIAGFTGSERFVVDYVVEEVLTRLPESTRSFLERTSILHQLSGPLCDVILDRHDCATILEELEGAHLFLTPVDDRREWYSYHQLFADAVRHGLHLSEPELVRQLHQRASDWFVANGRIEEAVEHALAAQSWERAAELIALTVGDLLRRGEELLANRWLDALPEELRQRHPTLSPHRAMTLLQMAEFQAAETFMDAAEPRLEARGEDVALGKVLSFHAMLSALREDGDAALARADRALELLPEQEPGYRGTALNAITRAHLKRGDLALAEQFAGQVDAIATAHSIPLVRWQVHNHLAWLSFLRGELRRSATLYQELLDMIGGRPVFARQQAMIGLAGLAYEWNRLTEAAEYLERIDDQRAHAGRKVALPFALLLRARIACAAGDLESGEAALDGAEAAARTVGNIRLQRQARAERAGLALARGDLRGARAWADEISGGDWYDLESLAREPEVHTLVRVRLAQQSATEVQPLLAKLSTSAEQQGRISSHISWLTLLALSRWQCEDTAGAVAVMRQALQLAEPEGFVRLFLDQGDALPPLLLAVEGGPEAAYAARLVDPNRLAEQATAPRGQHVTRREREVLQLLALGLSNRAIANELVTTQATVKSHVHHLIEKLGVANRAQVVVRAHELGFSTNPALPVPVPAGRSHPEPAEMRQPAGR